MRAFLCYRQTVSRANSDEVDLTLIDEMLAMTPADRLQLNDRTIRSLAALRKAQEKYDDVDGPVEPASDAG